LGAKGQNGRGAGELLQICSRSEKSAMIRVGIIGCGKMADQHAAQIQRIAGSQIVGVCDAELLMARQMAERFGIEKCFEDPKVMLDSVNMDVVHITTPPQSHFELGRLCLEAGCHVYMEKPFTLNTADAVDLIKCADQRNLKITAGHNAQFTHAMVRMRELVNKGFLGGKPVHLESIYCYNLGDESYAKVLLADSEHWVRKLPGSLLQNIISHGISKIAEFLVGDNPLVIAHGFTSPFLERIGQEDIIDEVRVIIRDEDSTTAYFTFSSQIGPTLHQFRLHGLSNTLIVDDDHQVVIKMQDKGYKSYLRYFVPPFEFANQYIGNFGRNAIDFLKKDFHLPFDAGLKRLIESFYIAILRDTHLPLSYREILLTSKIMDDIFDQIRNKPRS
jgi:predicted dehydrogenase